MGVTPGFWAGKRVFVTGHTGFKGAWLSLWLSNLHAVVAGYALRPSTDPSLFVAARVGECLESREGDILDFQRMRTALREAAPQIVLHLAAQALVRPSYQDPLATFSTNLMGTVHVLEACRAVPSVRAVVIVTSDKCYEESGSSEPHDERDPLGGYDPYAASKACAEIATAAYRRSFYGQGNAAVASVRAGNVIGGGDWASDRLLPDLVRAFSAGQRAMVRYPAAIRPWQHVLDSLSGYLMLAERLFAEGSSFGEPWNFAPPAGVSPTVGEIADIAASVWGENAAWASESRPQPREAPSLVLDAGKAVERLGWKPQLELDTALEWTVSWYRNWYQGADARGLSVAQIARFMEAQLP